MYDEFDLFKQLDNEHDHIPDDGRHLLTEHETAGFDVDFGSHPIENSAELGDLAPSDNELHHLERLEESSSHPDNSEAHHEISFGSSDTISCSDCSGGCAAYCAGIFK